jgi:hypothetical protein
VKEKITLEDWDLNVSSFLGYTPLEDDKKADGTDQRPQSQGSWRRHTCDWSAEQRVVDSDTSCC